MRLKILLAILVSILVGGVYFYGYNKGSDEERAFTKQVLLPLCFMMTPNNKDQLALCLDQNL